MEELFGYEVIKELGKGKTGISYLVCKDEKQFVLKQNYNLRNSLNFFEQFQNDLILNLVESFSYYQVLNQL